MDRLNTKADLLNAIQNERVAWESLVAKVGPENMQTPGAMGDWTFKDLAAHLTGWRYDSLRNLEAARRGEEPAPPPWPPTDDVDQINQWIYEQNRDRTLQDVLDESRQSLQKLVAAIEALPERDLMEPGRFAWLKGNPLGPAVVSGSLSHYFEEHAGALQEWVDRVTGAPSSERATNAWLAP